MKNIIATVLWEIRRTFDYKGVSTRTEYWVTTITIGIIIFMMTTLIHGTGLTFLGFLIIASILVIMSLSVRRLRDTGHSLWFLLLSVGIAFYIYFPSSKTVVIFIICFVWYLKLMASPSKKNTIIDNENIGID